MKKYKAKTLELVLTTVLISSGVNLLVVGISTAFTQINYYVILVAGILLVVAPIMYILCVIRKNRYKNAISISI